MGAGGGGGGGGRGGGGGGVVGGGGVGGGCTQGREGVRKVTDKFMLFLYPLSNIVYVWHPYFPLNGKKNCLT